MATAGPFKSSGQASVALATVSAATGAAIPGDGESIVIVNAGSVTAFVDFSPATLTVTTSAPYVVPAGLRAIIPVQRGVPLFAAAISVAAATGSVYFMRGDGSIY